MEIQLVPGQELLISFPFKATHGWGDLNRFEVDGLKVYRSFLLNGQASHTP
jgi:hypothetical protein